MESAPRARARARESVQRARSRMTYGRSIRSASASDSRYTLRKITNLVVRTTFRPGFQNPGEFGQTVFLSLSPPTSSKNGLVHETRKECVCLLHFHTKLNVYTCTRPILICIPDIQ